MQLIELRCDLCFKVQFTLALMAHLPLPHRDTLVCVCWGQLKRAAATRIKIEDTQCA